jgi:hypothetical protein
MAGALLDGQREQMDLIEVGTGLTIPLPYTNELQAKAPFWLE